MSEPLRRSTTWMTRRQFAGPYPPLIILLLTLLCPVPAMAFWGLDDREQPALNLESGYDVNTVTTVSGRILSVHTGQTRRNVQLEIDTGKERMVVILGPQRYLEEQGGLPREGDEISVRGSKAQGRDGRLYILAREFTDTRTEMTMTLRDQGGFPRWAAGNQRRKKGIEHRDSMGFDEMGEAGGTMRNGGPRGGGMGAGGFGGGGRGGRGGH